MNRKKSKHTCKHITGTQSGMWSVKIGRLYFYCSDIMGWHFQWLHKYYDKKLYGGFISIHTAFGAEECNCGE